MGISIFDDGDMPVDVNPQNIADYLGITPSLSRIIKEIKEKNYL